MKTTIQTKLVVVSLLPAAILAFTGCTHTKPSPFTDSPNAITEKGVPGGVIVENYSDLSARVTAIDPVKRTVTVVESNGKQTTFVCGLAVRNFDQIRVGNQLKAKLTELVSVSVVDANDASPDGSSALLLRAPEGSMPAAATAETTQITATITGIDGLRNIVSLRFPDGTLHHYAVRPDVNLNARKLGEKVVIRRTTAMAAWVETR